MNKRIVQELKDMFEVIMDEYNKTPVEMSFEEFAIPIVAMNLSMKYTPEEVAIFVKDKDVRNLFKLYSMKDGVKH